MFNLNLTLSDIQLFPYETGPLANRRLQLPLLIASEPILQIFCYGICNRFVISKLHIL